MSNTIFVTKKENDILDTKKINYIQGKLFLVKSQIKGFIKEKEKITGILKPSSLKFQSDIKIPFSQKYKNYLGKKEIIPSFSEQILNTKNKIIDSNVKVFQIQTYETSNEFGTTFII